jgi:hypothetical protein
MVPAMPRVAAGSILLHGSFSGTTDSRTSRPGGGNEARKSRRRAGGAPVPASSRALCPGIGGVARLRA